MISFNFSGVTTTYFFHTSLRGDNFPSQTILNGLFLELNHLAAILHVYAGGFEFYEVKKIFLLLFFKKKMEILLHF